MTLPPLHVIVIGAGSITFGILVVLIVLKAFAGINLEAASWTAP
jgi:hypothetical protein